MDKSAVEQIANSDTVRAMRAALSLNEWVIHMRFDRIDEHTRAMCEPQNGYSEATITIDPENAPDEGCVLDSLFHEQLHLIVSEFELYRKAVRPFIVCDDQWASLEEVFKHAAEATVRRTGSAITSGLGMSIEDVIAIGEGIIRRMESEDKPEQGKEG